jgi:hypothetical protein
VLKWDLVKDVEMMTASPVDRKRPANDSLYHSLLADFKSAHRSMKSASDDLNATIGKVAMGAPGEEARLLITHAARAYEYARADFEKTVVELNAFVLNEIVSSHSAIREATSQLR